jgi:hypothetical protein
VGNGGGLFALELSIPREMLPLRARQSTKQFQGLRAGMGGRDGITMIFGIHPREKITGGFLTGLFLHRAADCWARAESLSLPTSFRPEY